MHPRRLLVLLLVLLALSTCLADEDEGTRRKAIRMKSTRQLKEIMTELKIKHTGLGKDELKELAFRENVVWRWEELHPEKKKPKRSPETEEREQIIAKLTGMGMKIDQVGSMSLEQLRGLDKSLGGLGNLFGGAGLSGLKERGFTEPSATFEDLDGEESEAVDNDHEEL